MLHVIERATGRIVEVCAEGSDTSRFDGEGYLVVSDPAAHDPETERWDAEAGEWVGIPEAELLAEAKVLTYKALSTDYASYLVQRGYDLAWRDAAREARGMFEEVLKSATATDEQRAAAQKGLARINALRDWMMGTVRSYFQGKGRAIFAAASMADLDAIDWDFHQHDSTDPGVTLGAEIFPLLDQATGAAE